MHPVQLLDQLLGLHFVNRGLHDHGDHPAGSVGEHDVHVHLDVLALVRVSAYCRVLLYLGRLQGSPLVKQQEDDQLQSTKIVRHLNFSKIYLQQLMRC